jgi:hypothetical protein
MEMKTDRGSVNTSLGSKSVTLLIGELLPNVLSLMLLSATAGSQITAGSASSIHKRISFLDGQDYKCRESRRRRLL